MKTIAVTGSGFGSVLKFGTPEEAFVHPVVQYGDVILTCEEDIHTNYPPHEFPRLMIYTGISLTESQRLVLTGTNIREARAVAISFTPMVIARLGQMAVEPPSKLEHISAMVARDRKGIKVMSEVKQEVVEKVAKAPKVAKVKEPKAPKEPKVAKVKEPKEKVLAHPAETVLHPGIDDEGHPYSDTNSPVREGSGRHDRFLAMLHAGTYGKVIGDGMIERHALFGMSRGWVSTQTVDAQRAANPHKVPAPPKDKGGEVVVDESKAA